MTHQKILEKLNDYNDQSLSEAERAEVAEHLKSCESCSRAMQKLSRLISDAASLPKTLQPARDLWNEIEPKLGVQQQKVFLLPSAIRPKGFAYRSFLRASVRIAAVLVAAVGTFLLTTRTSYRSWEVARLEGTPTIEENLVARTGRLGVGQWLETDETSRARIAIADIGHAQIGPNSKLRLLVTRETEHRLEMLRGHMKASVYSPPRIFIVETPSATAVDLGCVYDLFVNDAGNGTIHVTSGEVSMEFNGVESFVPTGTMCETKRGVGPGIPYSDLSSETMRQALRRFDFEEGGKNESSSILTMATNIDAISLWHLLSRVDPMERGSVYDRFASLVPPPKDVTRDGILKLDKNMLESWLDEFAVRSFSLQRLLSSR